MRMTITQNTSIADVNRELQKANAKDIMLAKRNPDQTITLYTRPKDRSAKGIARSLKEGMLGKLGLSQDKTRLAQQIIRSVIRYEIRNEATANAGMYKAVGSADYIRGRLSSLLEFTAKQFDKHASNKVGNVTNTLTKLVEITDAVSATLRPFRNVTKEEIPPLPPTQNRPLAGSEQVAVGNGGETQSSPT